MQLEYSQISLNKKFFTIPNWFIFFAPMSHKPYKIVDDKAKELGFLTTDGLGILEIGKFIGRGKVGVEVLEGDFENVKNLTTIEGEFTFCEYKGSFKNLHNVFKQIMKDNNGCKEFYCFYPDSPENTAENDLRTRIIFR